MFLRITARTFVVLAVLAGSGAPAEAAFFFADGKKDLPDAQLDGTCATVAGTCTIRAAIQEANFVPGEDVVSIPAGKYTLSLKGAGEDAAATGDLDVTENLTVNGVFNGTVIKGKKDRVLDVAPGVTLTIRNLTIAGGSVGGKGVTGDDASGGCVRNRGTVLASSITITGCKATNDGGAVANLGGSFGMSGAITKSKAGRDGGAGVTTGGTFGLGSVNVTKNKAGNAGGGVAAHADVEIFQSTLDGNVAGAGGGGALAATGGTATVTNVTISGNKSKEAGGGVRVGSGAVAHLLQVTLKSNKAKLPGAALANDGGGTVTLGNSILDTNKKTTCAGAVTTLGGNVEDTTTCGLGVGEVSGVKDLGVAKKLVRNNAGTFDHPLKPGSVALDAGVDAQCTPEDQRLLPRLVDVPNVGTSTCDAGAVEMQLDELQP